MSIRRLAALLLLLTAALLWTPSPFRQGAKAQVTDPCAAPVTNPVACENTLPGNPAAEWDVVGAGSDTIQGFATEISVNRGETVRFKVDTPALGYRVDIYRLGYYGGAGARKVATVLPTAALPQAQPACAVDNNTGLVDCGTWAESASWAVPSTAVSGIYLGRLVRTDGVDAASHMVFIVRDDTGGSDLLFQTSDTTWHAYNEYGGNSLYAGSPAGRAYKVSYNRPFATRATNPEDWLFNAEYPMVRWLEANGYNVSYSTGIDTDRRGGELLEHEVFLSVGHDEYWSAAQRANVEAARDAGVHLAFFSGNEVFWKTRYEPSIDGSSSAYRTLVCYKETHANAKIDPQPNVWTGTWRDPRFSPPADGGRPENGLTGTIFTVNDPGTTSIDVPAAYGALRFWRNTSIAGLAPGATGTLPFGTLGYEWNEVLNNGAQPLGLIRLSLTNRSVPSKLQDYGSSYASGTATHSLTLYRAPSGSLVFGAGTVQWSWGLDSVHDRGSAPPDLRMQQATVNLLADMGVQPLTPQSGLVVAAASTDVSVPAATITTPTAGAVLLQGTSTTITGTASDVGGVVAAIEVSVDGGTSWASATGTSSWSFDWTPTTLGAKTIIARAVDDTGNIGVGASVGVTVGESLPTDCPCSLWPDSTVPAVLDTGADNPVELGVKVRSSVDGYITALRFYKSAANVGPHVGSLWRTSDGVRLATVTFSNESSSGWQTAQLSEPVPITANTVYVASYHAPTGHYSFQANYFASARNSGPLQAPASSTSSNGVFRYGPAGSYPNLTYNAANYWVDVVFATATEDTTPPTVISTTPAAGATGVDINANVTTVFSEGMDSTTVNGATIELRDSANAVVPAVVTYDAATRAAVLNPTAALSPATTYTVTVRGGASEPTVKDTAGHALAASFSWTFTSIGDTTPPTVTAFAPTAGAAGVPLNGSVTVSFSEPIDGATINGNTFELRDAANNPVLATIAFGGGTGPATLTPTSALAPLATYTATLRGGATDPRVKDVAGNALAANVTWSFTTQAAAPSGCPCTIWTPASTPATIDSNDNNAVELGLKFRSDSAGYITGVRFYKSAANVGTHLGRLWTESGTLLANVTFSNETSSGWQQAEFASPVAIAANTTYVVSYYAPSGRYSYSANYFSTGRDNAPLHALANSVSANGVFRYGTSGFPSSTYNAANYWVDVVFATTPGGPDTTAPTVASVAPLNGASGLPTSAVITATFSEDMDAATVNGTTVQLLAPGNVIVPGTVTYSAGTRTVTLQPGAALAHSTVYTARVLGGLSDPRVKDSAGNPLASTFSWSFTTGAQLPPSPVQGPGGPILVVTRSANPFSTYYAEILRAEGLNAFALADLSSVTASTLAAYDVVILSEGTLTPAQVSLFTTWVNSGGHLIAMRPDKQLAGLLGLVDTGTTLSEGYVLFSPTGAGAGLVNETIQFHGTADRYTLGAAVSVATLYSSATTATTNPAVSQRTVAGGGSAVAFTYDLARSVVYTRQGNPAWSGLERDGLAPVRSNDLFFPDYVNLDKIAIPQADEQQRLLANLIIRVNLDKKPLPRFWYLPHGRKAAIVMTGDDHGTGGTAGRFDVFRSASAAGCSVDDWECVRGTSYVYPMRNDGTPTLTDAQAAAYVAEGFDVALHLNTGCQNYTAASLTQSLDSQIALFLNTVPSAGAPVTNRTHCIAWSDYTTQAELEYQRGIRLDTNYYYWPGSWVLNRPGLFTGSGLPMRFAKTDGTMIDVYQAPTPMTDESDQTYPFTVDTLLDRALGPQGYYGTFVANMHTDTAASSGNASILSSAGVRGVAIISSKQLLTWLDGRNGSSFGSLTWATNLAGAPQGGSTLSFSITTATGSTGLEAMLPARLTGGIGRISSLTRNGNAIAFELKTVKGIEYAVFPAAGGAHVATYDTTAPNTTLTATPPASTLSGSASFSYTSTEAASTFQCRLDGGAFAACSSPTAYTSLGTGSHTFEVRATDDAGNVDTTPASYTWTVDVTAPTVTARTPAPGTASAALTTTVTATFSEAVSAPTPSMFRLRRLGATTDVSATVTMSGNTATLTPSAALLLGVTYEATVAGTVTDTAGNAMGSDVVWTFTTASGITDTTVAHFSAGSVDASGRVTQTSDGEVMLAPTDGSEFAATTLPAGWSTTPYMSGGAASISGGILSANGSRVYPSALYPAGRVLEFAATFSSDAYQHVGFGLTLAETPWAVFGTGTGGAMYARSHNGTSSTDTVIPGSWLGSSHRYRIEWNVTTIVFYIDGTQVASHTRTISATMRPVIADYNSTGNPVRVDWLRMTPYLTPSTFTSRVFDAGAPATWTSASWTADLPAGTSVVVSVRTGNTETPDGSWTPFTTVSVSGGALNLTGRYAQYRLLLTTTAPGQSPMVTGVTLAASVQ